MPNIPVIVQARMTSSRLPGKVLKHCAGKTYLEHCLDRCAKIKGISEVIVATVDQPDCDPIAELCLKRGYRFFRGSQEDVLKRYLKAAQEVNADAIMRVTSDCPLTDPELNSAILQEYTLGKYDLVTNNIPPSWPLGFDVELFSREALEEADREANTKSEREHVTPFIRRRPRRYRLHNLPSLTEGFAHWRLTLDTKEDDLFFQKLAKLHPEVFEEHSWRKVFEVLTANPKLQNINTDEHWPVTP